MNETRKRKFIVPVFVAGFFLAVLLIVCGITLLRIVLDKPALRSMWPVHRHELPRTPEFDDSSAFGASEVAQIDAWLHELVEHCEYPSLSVAIVRDGQIVYQGAFGFENTWAFVFLFVKCDLRNLQFGFFRPGQFACNQACDVRQSEFLVKRDELCLHLARARQVNAH